MIIIFLFSQKVYQNRQHHPPQKSSIPSLRNSSYAAIFTKHEGWLEVMRQDFLVLIHYVLYLSIYLFVYLFIYLWWRWYWWDNTNDPARRLVFCVIFNALKVCFLKHSFSNQMAVFLFHHNSQNCNCFRFFISDICHNVLEIRGNFSL